MVRQIPMVSYLELGDDPQLVANECDECGARYFDRRNACARCGRRSFTSVPLARTGVVRAFTIVHRAAKGVRTPFASAVIDLDGGATVKGNVTQSGTGVVPEDLSLGMKVRLITYVAGSDDEGTEAVCFGFEPA